MHVISFSQVSKIGDSSVSSGEYGLFTTETKVQCVTTNKQLENKVKVAPRVTDLKQRKKYIMNFVPNL